MKALEVRSRDCVPDSLGDRLQLSHLNKQCNCSNSQLWPSLQPQTSLRGTIKVRKFKTDSCAE